MLDLDSPRERRMTAAAVAMLIVLLSASLTLADAPKAVLSQTDMGAFVVIRTDGSEGATLDLFAVPDTAPFVRFNDYALGADGKPQLRPVAIVPKGASLTVVLIAAGCQGDTVALAREALVIGGGPTPPDPPRPPDPKPVPGEKQVALIAESGSLDRLPPAQRALLASLSLRQELSSRGHRLLGVLDPDQAAHAPAAYAPWFQAAQGKPLPAVAVAPKGGGTIEVFPLPADADGLWTLLGGK